jgi:hypothetical protein
MSSQQEIIHIKLVIDSTIRKLDFPTNVTLSALDAETRKHFPIDENTTLLYQYLDDHKNWNDVASADEWRRIINEHCPSRPLKVRVRKSSTNCPWFIRSFYRWKDQCSRASLSRCRKYCETHKDVEEKELPVQQACGNAHRWNSVTTINAVMCLSNTVASDVKLVGSGDANCALAQVDQASPLIIKFRFPNHIIQGKFCRDHTLCDLYTFVSATLENQAPFVLSTDTDVLLENKSLSELQLTPGTTLNVTMCDPNMKLDIKQDLLLFLQDLPVLDQPTPLELQQEQLHNMGFTNNALNERVLRQTGCDLNKAVNLLINTPQ